jgi:hypothetical protein
MELGVKPGAMYSLRLALNQAGIPWKACFPDGRPLKTDRHIPTLQDLCAWFSEAEETGVQCGDKLILVSSVEAAKAVMRQAEIEEVRSEPPNKQAHRQARRGDAGYMAQKFLVEFLAGGTRTASAVLRAAKAQGIAGITLRRAARVAGVVVEPVTRAGSVVVDHWTWRLGDTNWKPKAPKQSNADGGRGSGIAQRYHDHDRPEGFGRELIYPKLRY